MMIDSHDLDHLYDEDAQQKHYRFQQELDNQDEGDLDYDELQTL